MIAQMRRLSTMLTVVLGGMVALGSGCRGTSSQSLLYEKGYDIWIMNADGSQSRRVAYGGTHPQWAPGGKDLIAFLQEGGYVGQGPNNAIFTMDSRGEKLVRITDWTAGKSFSWSPDRQWIAFEKFDHGRWKIFKVKANGTGLTPLTDGPGEDRNPRWSPAGGLIAFESNRRKGDWDIWVMAEDGSKLCNVTGTGFGDGPDKRPSWSPDGSLLAYVGDHKGWGPRVFLAKPYTSWGEPFSPPGLRVMDWPAAWSPGGETIFYVVKKRENGAAWGFALYEQPSHSAEQNAHNLSECDVVIGDHLAVDEVTVYYGKVDARTGQQGLWRVGWQRSSPDTYLDSGCNPHY